MTSRRTRPGFSLFDLLVLLAILGLLLAFLLPAIAKVRQAAGRTQSANNLRQIALAAINYADSMGGTMPPGRDANGFSAAAYLLPYIEQANLFRSLDMKKSIDDTANAEARKTVVQVFLSPQDPLVSTTDQYAATNYLFNAGAQESLENNNGIFYQDSKVRYPADILDGTSNTVLAGETLRGDGGKKPVDMGRQHVRYKKDELKNLGEDSGVKDWEAGKNIAGDRGASWLDGRFLQGTFTGTRTINDKRPDVDCGGAGGLSGLRTLGPVTNIALCDGSVRSVNSKMSLDTWKIVTGRNDGKVIPGDF